MHARRGEIDAALTDLRNVVPGGKIVDFWFVPVHDPPEKKTEQDARIDAHHDQLAEILDAALALKRFEAIDLAERSPPDDAMLIAWALHRAGAPLADSNRFMETKRGELHVGGSDCDLVVYRGPLELEGMVRICGTVIVIGDLIVRGGLIDGYATESSLVVFGNEKVTALRAKSDHLVSGTFDADVLWIASEEATFSSEGRMSTRITLSDHWGRPHPAVPDLDKSWSYDLLIRESDEPLDAAVNDWLDPAPTGELTSEALFDGISAGKWKVRATRR